MNTHNNHNDKNNINNCKDNEDEEHMLIRAAEDKLESKTIEKTNREQKGVVQSNVQEGSNRHKEDPSNQILQDLDQKKSQSKI